MSLRLKGVRTSIVCSDLPKMQAQEPACALSSSSWRSPVRPQTVLQKQYDYSGRPNRQNISYTCGEGQIERRFRLKTVRQRNRRKLVHQSQRTHKISISSRQEKTVYFISLGVMWVERSFLHHLQSLLEYFLILRTLDNLDLDQ